MRVDEDQRASVIAVEQWLDGFLRDAGLPGNLEDAIRYSLLDGGKRLRPMLAWQSATAVGGVGEVSLPAGAAVELVHAFSLVHDDLPAMDDDAMRRGKATLHVHAGEAMAILAGDAMLTLAFGALERVDDPALQARLVQELTRGTSGMIAGQVYDTLGGFGPERDERVRLEMIHRNKTGALIVAACRMGAICARADDAGLEAISGYATAVGLQFQVVDDLIDAVGDSAEAGKATGKDADAGKVTYPGVHGIEASRREAERLHIEAVAALEPLGKAARGLRELSDLLAARTR